MTIKNLAGRIDDFECELETIKALIDILYTLPRDHPAYQHHMEMLHSHKIMMEERYELLRPVLFKRLFG